MIKRNSNPRLWDAVCLARKPMTWTEFPRLECSDKDRYTVTMLLSQYLSFHTDDQNAILLAVGFTKKAFLDILTKNLTLLDDNKLDVIFGWEPSKGKIYLNCSNGYMVSYRTDNTKKFYVPYDETSNILVVYSDDMLVGIHKRIGNTWIAYDTDLNVVHRYWRPLPELLLIFFDLLGF